MEKIIEFPDKNLIQEEAGRWIVRFEGDEPPTKQDIEDLKAWMSRSPAHREILLQLASSWNDMDLLSELAVAIERERTPQLNGPGNLAAWILAPVILVLAILARTRWLFAEASGRFAIATAALILTVSVAVLSWQTFVEPGPGNTHQTSVGEQSSITLADGTVLRLNTNSKVEVDYTDEKRRIILHKGEAHFRVTPDQQRPFEVYADRKMIRAVGTAFSVYLDNDNNNVNVTVTEGKVDLVLIKLDTARAPGPNNAGKRPASIRQPKQISDMEKPEPEELEVSEVFGSLVAGQSVVIPSGDNGVMDKVVSYEQQELLRRLAWLEGRLVFAGEPLEEVVKEVSRYTSLRIEITDPELRSMRIGGQFQVGKVEALFDVLESGFGVEVTRLSDEHLQIHAKR